VLTAQREDYARQGHVDGCRVKGWADGDADDLHDEGGEVEGVLVQHDAAAVADHLVDAAHDHGRRERPCPVFDALEDVDDHGDAEQDDEHAVGR